MNIPESPGCCGHHGHSRVTWKTKHSCFKVPLLPLFYYLLGQNLSEARVASSGSPTPNFALRPRVSRVFLR